MSLCIAVLLPIPSHLNVPTSTYHTKSQASFINPSSKGSIYANSFFPIRIKDWNPLPEDRDFPHFQTYGSRTDFIFFIK